MNRTLKPVLRISRTSLRTRAIAEAIEQRLQLTTSIFAGTSGDDNMMIEVVGANFRITRNNVVTTSPIAGVTRVEVPLNDGNDYVNIAGNAGIAFDVTGGNGDDSIWFTASVPNRNLDAIFGAGVTVSGGAGTDDIVLHDSDNTRADTFVVTSTRVDRTIFSGVDYNNTVESVSIQDGSANNVINVNSTASTADYRFAGIGSAGMTVNVGTSTAGMENILGDIWIRPGVNFAPGTITLNNLAGTTPRNWTLDIAGNASFPRERVTGLAGGYVEWDNDDNDNTIILNNGLATDSGTVRRLTADLTVGNGGTASRDQLTFGGGSTTLGMQSIGGNVSVLNGPGRTNFFFDDTGNAVSKTNIQLNADASNNLLTGLAPGTITYSAIETGQAIITTGSGNDTLNVSRHVGASALSLLNSGGTDNVRIGEFVADMLGIQASIVVDTTSPGATTGLFVDNGNTSLGITTEIDFDTTLGMQSITGPAPQPIYFDPTIISSFGVWYVDSEGAGQINVRENYAPLIIHNASTFIIESEGSIPNDVVTIGDASVSGVDDVESIITVNNLFSQTTLRFDDRPTSTPETVTIANDGTKQGLYLSSPPRAVFWNTSDVGPIEYFGGTGNDTFAVGRVIDPMSLDGGAGNDVFNVGDIGGGINRLDFIDQPVTLHGGAGNLDVISVNNAQGSAGTLNVNFNTLVHTSASTVNHASFEVMNIRPDNDGETITNVGTMPPANINLCSGPGNDTFNVGTGQAGFVHEIIGDSNGATGTDQINLSRSAFSAAPPIVLIGDGYKGGVSLQSGGATTGMSLKMTTSNVRLTSLNIQAGTLDIQAGSAVIDTSLALPFSQINQWLTTGYNGGDWLGSPGITSTSAMANPSTASVAIAQGSDLYTTFPAIHKTVSGVQGSSALLTYSSIGPDADQDGTVGFDDLLIVAQNYGLSNRTFATGDFNFDTQVDFEDLLLLAQRYGSAALSGESLLSPASGRLENSDGSSARRFNAAEGSYLPPVAVKATRTASNRA